MLNFDDNSNEEVKVGSLTGNWADNVIVSKILSAVSRVVKYTIMKFILSIVFVAILALVFGYNKKDKKLAEEMAAQGVRDNPVGMYNIFIKNKKPKIKITNDHPLYNSEVIKEWETEFNLKFPKLFQYITIKVEGGKEDLIVMKRPAFDINSEDKTPLKLELSTVFTDSAKNICGSFFGDVPTDFQKETYGRIRHKLRIKGIDDELTYENDDGEKYFRCVLDQETINDLLE